MKGKKKK